MTAPSLISFLVLLLGVFMTSVLITGWARRYALRASLIDVPNERSSHTVPTARGGGLGIAVPFLLTVLSFTWSDLLPSDLAWALIGGGGLIALIGWRDDHHHVPARWRLLVHLLAALWALSWLGGMESFDIGDRRVFLGWSGWVLSALGIAWFTNLYNFMDGIDGLAAMQAVCAGMAGGALLWLAGAPGIAFVAFVLASASAGFLRWNWPAAQIFMGDVGSGLLGFSFAVLALASERAGALPALVWVILLAVFVTDASFTLARRFLRGEPWHRPHRMHAYQRLAHAGFNHLQIVSAVALLNVFVLWPLAWLAWAYSRYLPVIFLALIAGSWVLWMSIQRKF